jgi:hypothetical protein
MGAATRRLPALLNATSQIATDEVDDEAGIPYSCPTKHHHSHHNSSLRVDQTLDLEHLHRCPQICSWPGLRLGRFGSAGRPSLEIGGALPHRRPQNAGPKKTEMAVFWYK